MKYFVACIVAMIVTGAAFATEGAVWKPEASFQLEGLNLQQTMLFVSGMAYALTEYSQELENHGMPKLFCPVSTGMVSSRLAFEILNGQFAGKKISSKEATTTVIVGLQKRFPCT